MNKQVKSVILAAGKGTRMESDLPKVLHPINGKAMVCILLDTLNKIDAIEENILVLGHKKDSVISCLGEHVSYVVQEKQLGTGHAVKMARDVLADFNGNVLIACGDCPLLSRETVQNLINYHGSTNTVCTLLTARLDNPSGYGRIVKKDDYVRAIVEELDADAETKEIKEVNSGVYLVDSKMLFEALDNIKNNNVKKEFYLTDIIAYFVSKGLRVNSFLTDNIIEIQGVNTKHQLEYLESVVKSRI
ncbi:MAG: NTP transferase domain-containing protein [Proteobacteria bacterium]|nr:NTP transferase domain-containing protein [Pseudomonadota bacterium]